MADATLAAALEERLLCLDGPRRARAAGPRAPAAGDRRARERRVVILAHGRSDALALSDRTVLLVDVPLPSFAERRVAWSELTGVGRHARRRGQVPALDRPDRRGRRGQPDRRALARRDAPDAADLDLGARYASVSSARRARRAAGRRVPLGGPRPARAPARAAALDLRLPPPPRPRALRLGLRAHRRPHAGAEGPVRGRVRHRQDDGRAGARRRARPGPLPRRPRHGRLQVHRGDREEPRADLQRRRRLQRDPLLRRGRRAVRQALRGLRLARPLRQHRGRLPAPADGGVPRRRDPRDELQAQHRRRVHPPARLRGRLPVPGGRRPPPDLGPRAPRRRAGRRRTSTSTSSPRSSSCRAARSATARSPPRSRPPTRTPRSRCATSCAPSRRSTRSRAGSRWRPTSSASTSSCACPTRASAACRSTARAS